MKRFNLIILSLLCISGLLVGIIGASALSSLQHSYKLSQTGTVPTNFALAFTIGGSVWDNQSAIAWGSNLIGGQTVTKTISIANVGNVPVTSITLIPSASVTATLPVGWTETLSAFTGTLNPGATATGTISLTPSANAVAGDYSWDNNIIASP